MAQSHTSPALTLQPDSDSDPTPLSTLASSLDIYHSDIPQFLNSLLAPLLPPPLPSPQPPRPPDIAPIDKTLNDLSTKLSLLSQDTSSALEQSIHDISRTVPRLAYDLQFMRESANGLQSSLSIVQNRVARQTDLDSVLVVGNGVNGDGHGQGHGKKEENEAVRIHRSLEKLTHLDKLKSRLESARDILREAESWSTLENELTTLIAKSEWTKAGQRLHEASRSMIVFQNTPAEYEERKRLLVSLQNELETSVSNALKESLEKEDSEECALFWEVFTDMDREDEFKGYYFKAKRERLLQEWKEARILEIQSPTPIIDESNPSTSTSTSTGRTQPVKFTAFIPRFYASVLEVLNTQVEQIPLIFPTYTAASTLAAFLQTTFDTLDPPFSARLSAVADYHGSEALPELIRAFKATEELGVAVQATLDRMAFNTQGGMLSGVDATSSPATATTIGAPTSISPGQPSTSPGMARTPSKRTTASKRFSRAPSSIHSGPDPVDSGWETMLYEPFLDLQSNYATLERRYLHHTLRSDPALNVKSLPSSSGKDEARAVLDRANALFSRADEAIARCQAFTHGYGSVGLMTSLEAYISSFLENQQRATMDSAKSYTNGKGKEKDELDFEGLDYSTDDWSSFQIGLRVLESCRDIHGKLGAYESRLNDAIKDVSRTLKASPGEGYKTNETTWGALILLQQSTLNTADLHTLVSSPPTPLLPTSNNQLEKFTRSAQTHLQSIVLAPLLLQLDSYPTLGIWAKPDKAPRKGELQVPTFSLSPTDVISKVSEGLLDLLRVFEVWAGEGGLGWSLETLPFIDTLPRSNEETKISPEAVLSTWISSLALTLLSHLTKNTLPSIKALTTNGQNQLVTDLGYLSNAVRALDVEWDDLGKWERAVDVSEEEYRSILRKRSASTTGQSQGQGGEWQGEEGVVLGRVARMRGWA